MNDQKYWIINPAINLFAGFSTGYALEKNGIPSSEIDYCVQATFPVALGTLECLVENAILPENCSRYSSIIGSNIFGLTIFNLGNIAGRYISRIT